MSIRLSGPSENLGNVIVSDEFDTLVLGEKTLPENQGPNKLPKQSVLLDRSEYPLLPEQGVRATFIEREDLGLGREESRHIARFGQLLLNGSGVHEQPDLVALKAFDELSGLKNEWAATAYINAQFEEQKAFIPLGIVAGRKGQATLMTLYEHGVVTADSVFWANKELNPEALRNEVILRTSGLCMYGLGLMHGSRLIHNDAEAKNLGFDRTIRFIDLEDAEVVEPEQTDDEITLKKLLNDIAVFIDSTGQVDENREQVFAILSKPKSIELMFKKYSEGINLARIRQQENGFYVPNYAELGKDAIISNLEETYK